MSGLHVISLGAGVQSTTMALMAAHGEIGPMPDCAIFADTGWEPKAVYAHLAWLMSGVLPFPVHVVSAGDIRADLMAGTSKRSGRFTTVPFFTVNADGSHGMGHRQCTSHYKVEPIQRKVRELLGYPKATPPAGSVEMWIGISLDEIIRATPSKVKFTVKRFPLLEQRMRRQDCLQWLKRHDYPEPGKSACIGCPFHGDQQWRSLPKAEFADAVEVDKAIRNNTKSGQQFMHVKRVPLDQVDLSSAEDRGQLNLFLNECEGMCGV